MNLTDRDRKIALVLVPLVVVVAYWFLLLAPKREEAATAPKTLTEQDRAARRGEGPGRAAQGAKTDFASDYTEIVRLGKAIPVERGHAEPDRAARPRRGGHRHPVHRIATGARDGRAPRRPPTAPATGATRRRPRRHPGRRPAARPRRARPGRAVESANNTAGRPPTSARRGRAVRRGPRHPDLDLHRKRRLPVGGGAATAAPTATAAAAARPASRPCRWSSSSSGNFFNLADFFHDMKRFVRVANNERPRERPPDHRRGRAASRATPEIFPRIRAEVKATVYLSPKAEGATAGATPAGPAPPGRRHAGDDSGDRRRPAPAQPRPRPRPPRRSP